ncbi:tRNA epoxyqueuosine(34) reductase QueG [Aliikangiella marina]|uniref:Epoxyqueuosine reductase n=1 Tax=Aliikangiella marina TaxID=1712262 RepID=A0A545TIN3_9GAMM|nr:tRNA epoxyqueuosine(34) reductase QueG [Aliikangiella marina]TQV77089.1 tRNA epoxyqueuosine(34) reductase QueG [Aliikangiella marina]
MPVTQDQLKQIKTFIYEKACKVGFQGARVSDISTSGYFEAFKQWVDDGFHGDMSFLERNQNLREFPPQLHPNTCRVISLRYDYLPVNASFTKPLKDTSLANISRYALGKDYHKLLRKKLSRLCDALRTHFNQIEDIDTRVFVDSAPVLETAFAEKSGIGWKGKHSLIINEAAGSWFFLAEIFINLPLALDEPVKDKCGSCNACIKLCPTDAIIGNKKVDATRCISYLTIENKGPIPLELRSKIGNRVYGCDDCQLACPWNRYASVSSEPAFLPMQNLGASRLLELWNWTEEDFNTNLQGSPIRRIGYQAWLRNLAVGIGNGPFAPDIISQLEKKKPDANDMVLEHINWAIEELINKNGQQLNLQAKTKKLINCVESMLARDA